MQLTAAQIAELTARYFGDLGPQVVADMTAIALAESGGDPSASNINPATRDDSHGLFQINVRPDANPRYASWNLADPEQNARAAREIYDQQGYGAWGAWSAGTALDRWDEAAGAVQQGYALNRTPITAAPQTGATRYTQAGQGSTPMVTSAGTPITTLTGVELTKLAAYVSDLLAGRRLQTAELTGQLNGQNTLARDMFGAARQDADRNYALDLQRFGLDYANTAFSQRLAAASQQLQLLDLQTQRSGPEDWLRYNHIINNAPGAPAPTVGGANPQVPQPTVGSQPPGPQGAGPMPAPMLPQPSQGSPWYIDGQQQPRTPQQFGTSPTGAWYSASPGEFDRMAQLAAGQQQQAQEPDWQQASNGGPGVSYASTDDNDATIQAARDLGIAFGRGGTTQPMLAFGGMHAGVTGDDPRGRGRENPELVLSSAPIHVMPLDAAGQRATAGLPHRGTGGTIGNPSAAPFVQKLTGGADYGSFGARGEALGPYGAAPLDYNRFLQLLPSEQAMTKGYIETPREQGGLGGWLPDELERGRRASFQGLAFGPSGYSAA